MKTQRTRPMDSLQGFMSSFKQFEKKLDKLQADVSYHGNTLTELRSMVAGLATGVTPGSKQEETKRLQRKTVGLQWEPNKIRPVRRPAAVQPLPNKLKMKTFMKTKSLQGQKYGSAMPSDVPLHAPKKVSVPIVGKHHYRPRKAEAPRKATTLRPQNNFGKMRSKIRK